MTKHFYNIMMVGALCASAIIVSCSKDSPSESPDPTPTPSPEQEEEVERSSYTEQYRPQIHFSPSKNWMNDPNGMVYYDGTYHLFYQYNPYSNDWGNMSWGHATSTDLIHWTEQSVALTRTTLGDIFSGSCVIDKDNTAGFGRDAMIALYTANGDKQQQAIAYSTDGGKSFTHYSGNPVIGNTTMNDFRDPKVFWHAESGQWIMSLAKGYEYAIDFYGSRDLKSWSKLSSFSVPAIARCNKGQWECPDLLRMSLDGEEKWVLIVSVNPGGPTSGSGTMYFVGNFDGQNFTADNLDYPLYLDYGMDNYAGVTWSNTADRTILLGWMNNWNYAGSVPCTPWRSAMTLPRELSLVNYNGTPLLASRVVSEIDKLAGSWTSVLDGEAFPAGDAYHLQVTLSTTSNQTVTLQNGSGQKFVLELNAASRRLVARRNASTGDISFNGQFSMPSVQAPLNTDAAEVTLDIYIDRSSVEVLSSDGTVSMTNLVFPTSIYNSCTTTGTARVCPLKTIW